LLQLVDVTYTTFIILNTARLPALVVDVVPMCTLCWPEVRTDEVGCLPLQQLDGVTGEMCWSAIFRQTCCLRHVWLL